MSFTEKRLCNPTQLTTIGQTLYTVPASKTAIVKQIVVTNVTGSAATFSLFIGSAATPNALFSATSVAANDAIVINLSQVLNSTEILTALASANSTLNITISGVENDGPLNPLSTYIADGAITTAKLADSSVTTAKIAAGAVVNADIADNAVTQTKLASGLSGATIVTSSTRSTLIPSPFTGQICYETDTGYLRVWDGSAWDYLSQKQDYTAGLTTGKIVQVVWAQATSGVNNTTNTLADSGLQASITPQSTSNKILVTISQAFMRYGGTNTYTSVAVAILRNSTMIFSQNGFLYTAVGGETLQGQWPYSHLDSPATTSSVTYKTQFCLHPYAGSGTVSAQPSTGSGYSYSSITLCEVVA